MSARATRKNGVWIVVGDRPGFYCWEHERTVRSPKVQSMAIAYRGTRRVESCRYFNDPSDALDCDLTPIEVRA